MKKFLCVVLALSAIGMVVQLPSRAAEPAVKVEAESDADDALKKQVDLLREKAGTSGADDKPMVEPAGRSGVQSALSRLEQQIAGRDYRSAVQTCESLGNYGVSTSFKKLVADFTAQLRAQIKLAQAAVAAQVRAFLAELPAACAKANPEELEKFSEKLQELQNALTRVNGNSSGELNPAMASLRENLHAATTGIREWMNARIAEDAGDLAKALEAMNKLSSSYTSSSFWQNAKEYGAKMDSLRAALAAKMETVIAAAREAMTKATTAREIEAATAEFNKQTEQLRRALSYDTLLQQQVEGLRNVLSLWSRVLAAEEKNEVQQALAQLASMDSDYMGTRTDSKLRAVMMAKRDALTKKLFDNQPVQTDDAVTKLVADEMKKADTIEKLLALKPKLASLQSVSGFRSMSFSQGELSMLVSDISMLEALNNALQSRQFMAYLQAYPVYGPSTTHRWKDTTRRHWNVLKAQLFATIFDLGTIKLAANETTDQALMKEADSAQDDKEWGRALRALDAYRVCMFGNQTPPATLADQIDSVRNFIAAKNFEKAGELEQAAACYLRVLQAPTEHTPVAAATKEIARLRKERPELFDKLRAAPPAPLTKLEHDGSTRGAVAAPYQIYGYGQQLQFVQ